MWRPLPSRRVLKTSRGKARRGQGSCGRLDWNGNFSTTLSVIFCSLLNVWRFFLFFKLDWTDICDIMKYNCRVCWCCNNFCLKPLIEAWKIACSFPTRTRIVFPASNTFLVHPIELHGPCRSRVTLRVWAKCHSSTLHTASPYLLYVVCILIRYMAQSMLPKIQTFGKVETRGNGFTFVRWTTWLSKAEARSTEWDINGGWDLARLTQQMYFLLQTLYPSVSFQVNLSKSVSK